MIHVGENRVPLKATGSWGMRDINGLGLFYHFSVYYKDTKVLIRLRILAVNEGPDQTAHLMRSLIRTFVVRICNMRLFSHVESHLFIEQQ